jgi:hypothetical protein
MAAWSGRSAWVLMDQYCIAHLHPSVPAIWVRSGMIADELIRHILLQQDFSTKDTKITKIKFYLTNLFHSNLP